MTVKYGEMENLVTPTISIDQYTPRLANQMKQLLLRLKLNLSNQQEI